MIVLLLIAACHRAAAPAPAPAVPPVPDASPSAMAVPAPTSADDTCAHDDDCLVTNFPGCCACPQCSKGQPQPRSRGAEKIAEAACAAASCDMHMCDLGGMCPPGEDAGHFVARCRAGTCAMDHR
jgi:hypothetical protein